MLDRRDHIGRDLNEIDEVNEICDLKCDCDLEVKIQYEMYNQLVDTITSNKYQLVEILY